jgi:hypothetical protein
MRYAGKLAALGLVCIMAAACNDDSTSSNNCAGLLSGNYSASTATITSNSTGQNRDLLQGGGTYRLNFGANNAFTSTYTGAGLASNVQAGTTSFNGSQITLGNNALFNGAQAGAQTFTCQMNSNGGFTLSSNNTNFDFAGNGTYSAGTFSATFNQS